MLLRLWFYFRHLLSFHHFLRYCLKLFSYIKITIKSGKHILDWNSCFLPCASVVKINYFCFLFCGLRVTPCYMEFHFCCMVPVYKTSRDVVIGFSFVCKTGNGRRSSFIVVIKQWECNCLLHYLQYMYISTEKCFWIPLISVQNAVKLHTGTVWIIVLEWNYIFAKLRFI